MNGSCADGASGAFHSDESVDRLKVSTSDGSALAAGKTVRIEATVWAWTTPSQDSLDLYFAANANSPSWTFLTTIVPTAVGAQTLTATYTLPAGALQAVRARFRYQGAATPCGTGSGVTSTSSSCADTTNDGRCSSLVVSSSGLPSPARS